MFAIVAAVLFFLRGVGVIDNTADIDWVLIAAAFWALHFGFPFSVGTIYTRSRDNS